jgi:hypothetical protein
MTHGGKSEHRLPGGAADPRAYPRARSGENCLMLSSGVLLGDFVQAIRDRLAPDLLSLVR